MPRSSDHHRSMADPFNLADAFASGVDVQDFDDWIRLVWSVQSNGGRGARRKVASVVIPRSALQALVQELRGSASDVHDGKQH